MIALIRYLIAGVLLGYSGVLTDIPFWQSVAFVMAVVLLGLNDD